MKPCSGQSGSPSSPQGPGAVASAEALAGGLGSLAGVGEGLGGAATCACAAVLGGVASAEGLGSCLLQWLSSPSVKAKDHNVAERSPRRFEEKLLAMVFLKGWGENMRRG